MICLVKFPDCLPSSKVELYKKSACLIFEKISRLRSNFDEIIAIGPANLQSLWQGKSWLLNSNEKVGVLLQQSSGYIVVIGLDAPLISHNTIEDFIVACPGSDKVAGTVPLCTFRKTPDQKNPATVELGGRFFCMITKKEESIDINAGTQIENGKCTAKKIAVDFLKNEVKVCSTRELNVDCICEEDAFPPSIHILNQISPQEGSAGKQKNRVEIKINGNCNIVVSEIINAPRLYSKIHYTLPPLTIDGLIGVTEKKTRKNLKNGREIHGRQAFPEIYEPFLGMVCIEKTECYGVLNQEGWLGKQKTLNSFIVKAEEAYLISEDALFLKSKLSGDTA